MPAGLAVTCDEWLELLASVHYLKHIVYWPKDVPKNFDAVFEKLAAQKPQFRDKKSDVRRAWDLLNEFGLIAAKSLT